MIETFMVGYDYHFMVKKGVKIKILAPCNGHYIICGGSGSGKSTALLYWIYKLKKEKSIDLYIADFKKSKEFEGITDKDKFAEYESCYELIKRYYEEFQNTAEGGCGKQRILIIDEIAGMLTHFSMTKDGKKIADEIRLMMSEILMLGRSRECFIWLSMQRYTATIFPPSAGSADNFHVCVGLGVMTVQGRMGLFAGEHFEGEDDLQYGQARGIILIDGQPLQSIVIPKVDKKKLLKAIKSSDDLQMI